MSVLRCMWAGPPIGFRVNLSYLSEDHRRCILGSFSRQGAPKLQFVAVSSPNFRESYKYVICYAPKYQRPSHQQDCLSSLLPRIFQVFPLVNFSFSRIRGFTRIRIGAFCAGFLGLKNKVSL
ncbi:hypothetical protein M5K25_010046 [Dendrobium thyrsiflorum]|uniref:Uncharacterized protein n=1 Tax=Dendrobium thyrsiflorum TaxID=117978 RepID=A0ABD0V6J4_DENTH